MENAHSHDIKKEVRGYIIVFVALLVLTLVTVAVNYLHLNLTAAIILALCIATFKAGLVACYFMHLVSERTLIYAILTFTVFFFAALAFLLMSGYHDIQRGVQFVS